MNTLTLLLQQLGVTRVEAAEATGITYATLWRHCNGSRLISAEDAIKYEKGLGIAKYLLRPDLWPAPVQTRTAKEEDV